MAGALLVAASGSMPMVLAGVLVVEITKDMRISDSTFGWGIGMFFLTSALVSTRCGRLVDRIGWRWSSLIAATVSFSSLAGVAVFSRSFPLLVACLVLGGAGQALAMPATNLTLMREVAPERQGVAFGIKQTSVPLAGLLAGLSVPAVALTLGWRWSFGLAAGVPIAAGILAQRRQPPLLKEPLRSRSRARVTLDRGPLIALAVGGALAAAAVTAFSAFVVASAVSSGVPVGTAGLFVSIASAAGLIVRVLGGWVADHWSSRGLRPSAGLLAIGATGLVLLATQQAALVLPGMVVTYAAGWGWPGLFHYGVSAYHPEAPASATGTVQVGVMTGGTLGPIAAGRVASSASYDAVWLLCALLVVIAAACLLIADRMLNERRNTPSP